MLNVIGILAYLFGGMLLGVGLRDAYLDKRGIVPDNAAEFVSIIGYGLAIIGLGTLAFIFA